MQQTLRDYQQQLISELLVQSQLLIDTLQNDLHRLVVLLSGGDNNNRGGNSISEAVYTEIVGHGEIWSARLLAVLLVQQGMAAHWLDSRDFLRAPREAQPKVDANTSLLLLQQVLQHQFSPYQSSPRQVITGFICRNQQGETVLLGGNGSGYSATQIGVLAGVINSRYSLRDYNGLQLSSMQGFFSHQAQPYDQQSLFRRLGAHPYGELIILDVTASQRLAVSYE